MAVTGGRELLGVPSSSAGRLEVIEVEFRVGVDGIAVEPVVVAGVAVPDANSGGCFAVTFARGCDVVDAGLTRG